MITKGTVKMNIYDISERAGVSIATISRVINGSSKVSEKTRKKVLNVIEESGYTPNVFARGLGLNTMKTVGILCADSSDHYLAQAVYYIEKNLRKNNYDSFLICTGYDLEEKKSSINLMLSKRVDAIILVGSNYVEPIDKNNDYIREAAQKLPLMIVNGVLDSINIYSTVCDDFNAIYKMTDAFIKNGRHNLLYLYNSKSYSSMRKLQGFKSAVNDNKLPVKEDRIIFTEKSITSAKKLVTEVLNKKIVIDGIISAEDILAIGALKCALQKGIKIPDDLFISGFNNFELAECCEPELTSIDSNLEAICNHCVSTLMGVFDGEDMPKTTVFSSKIVERNTTKFI